MIDTRHRNTALLVAGCFFMEMLDGTIVSTAAPRIAASLHVTAAAVGLVVTAYLLTLAVLIPLSGWMTRRFGMRKVFLSAIAIFTVSSLLCALSVSLGELVAMRVLQGVGGSMMVPVGRMVVMSRTEKPDIPRILSFIVWPGLVAPVIAPLLGGVITTYVGWHWLFLINIPLGIVAFAVAWRLIEPGEALRPPPLDWLGVILTCSGFGALAYTAHLLSESTDDWPLIGVSAFVSVAALALAGRHLMRTPAPLMNLRIFRTTTYRRAIVDAIFYWIPVGAVPFILPLFFEEVLGWNAIKSGAVVLFVFVGNVGIKPTTTFIMNRFGFRVMLASATICLAATVVACAFVTSGTPVPLIALIALISGAARSVALTAYNTIAFADVPADEMRDANTMQVATTQTAAGLGVAAATVALRVGSVASGAGGAGAYRVAFCLLAAVTAVPVIGALRIRPGAGDVLRALPTEKPKSAPAP